MNYNINSYYEPCFGGGSIGLNLLKNDKQIKNIWINDKDPAIADLWSSVISNPNKLCKLIQRFQPHTSYYYQFKELLLNNERDIPPIIKGFLKLALHQMSYSGLGTKSGGPIGGKYQKAKYKIDCRWSPNYIIKCIKRNNELFLKYNILHDKCSTLDLTKIIQSAGPNTLIYIDPPYYHAGNSLYQYGFSTQKHIELSKLLKQTKAHWLLSYDDCEEITNMYSWAKIEKLSVNYTIRGSNSNTEVIIYDY